MALYRKKPVVVDMIQWTGDNLDVVEAFGVPITRERDDGTLSFYVAQGQSDCTITIDDYIARERNDSGFYPVIAQAFADGYEPEPLG